MKKDRRKAAAAVEERGRRQERTADRAQSGAGTHPNNLRRMRESLLMSKAELARKAGLSALTIDRVEAGYNCRMDTKRKIILALGLRLADKDKVFGEQPEDA
jgi:DNA-binding XRE family transcriptional regulator